MAIEVQLVQQVYRDLKALREVWVHMVCEARREPQAHKVGKVRQVQFREHKVTGAP